MEVGDLVVNSLHLVEVFEDIGGAGHVLDERAAHPFT